MPAIRRPWTQRLYELIDDGVNQYDDLVRLTTPYVPEGHAFRTRERRNSYVRAGAARRDLRTPAEIHRIGAREVIRCTLAALVKDGYLVREGRSFRRSSSASRRETNEQT